MNPRTPRATRTDTLFPYTTLSRAHRAAEHHVDTDPRIIEDRHDATRQPGDHLPAHRYIEHEDRDGKLQEERAQNDAVSDAAAVGGYRRSEEHTSELQSLMRISYAVFCLKKTHNTSQIKRQIP